MGETVTGNISSGEIGLYSDDLIKMLSKRHRKKLLKSHNSPDTHFLKMTEKIKLPGKKRDLELTLLFSEDSIFFTTGSVVIK